LAVGETSNLIVARGVALFQLRLATVGDREANAVVVP